MKRVLSVLLAAVMLLVMLPLGAVSVSAADYEYAMFPGSVLKVTQGAYGEYNSFSHNGQGGFVQNAFDLGGNSNYRAPFSGTITKIKTSYNAVVFQSDDKVYWANGTLDYMSVTFVHDNDISDLYVGKHVNQGDVFYQPGVKDPGGYTTGTHLHICVNKGQTTAGISYFSGDTRPNEAFYLDSSTTIQQTGNYQWKTVNQTPITYSTIDTGTYLLKNNGLQQYANVEYGTDANNQNISIGDLGVWEGQVWASMQYEIKPSTTTAGYSIRPLSSGSRMVNVYGDTVASGNNVCIWEDTGHDSQRWQFEKVNGGYVIRNVQNPSCVLDANSDGNVYVSTYTGANTQIWSIQNIVTYDANGGTGAPDRQFKNYDESLTLSSTIPTCEGYLFAGWADSPNAAMAHPSYVTGIPYTANSNLTLYAVWYKECTHVYDNDCDASCNVCGAVRTPAAHIYTNDVDPSCNVCGAIRETTENPADVPAFVVEDVKACYGDTFTVVVRTQNNPGIVAVRLNVHYDADLLELVSAEEGAFAGVTYGPLTANPFTFTWVDALHPDNAANDAVVLLTFRAKEGTDPAQTVISLTYDAEDVYNDQWEGVWFNTVSGTVSLTSVTPGDANGDGKVNVRDLGLMQQYLNGWEVTVSEAAGDVNADGKFNVRDLGLLQQYLNGWDVELK